MYCINDATVKVFGPRLYLLMRQLPALPDSLDCHLYEKLKRIGGRM